MGAPPLWELFVCGVFSLLFKAEAPWAGAMSINQSQKELLFSDKPGFKASRAPC